MTHYRTTGPVCTVTQTCIALWVEHGCARKGKQNKKETKLISHIWFLVPCGDQASPLWSYVFNYKQHTNVKTCTRISTSNGFSVLSNNYSVALTCMESVAHVSLIWKVKLPETRPCPCKFPQR